MRYVKLWPKLHTSCEGQTPPQPQDLCGWIGCSGGPPGALPGALDPAIGCAFFCHHDWSGQKPKIRILKPFQKRFPFFQKCSKPTFEDFGLFTAIRRTKGISTNIFWGLPPWKTGISTNICWPKNLYFPAKSGTQTIGTKIYFGPPFPVKRKCLY